MGYENLSGEEQELVSGYIVQLKRVRHPDIVDSNLRPDSAKADALRQTASTPGGLAVLRAYVNGDDLSSAKTLLSVPPKDEHDAQEVLKHLIHVKEFDARRAMSARGR